MFAIIMPTIRDRTAVAQVIARIWETVTHPTDLFVIDGAEGKSATLNRAVPKYVDLNRHKFVVTIDDDLLVPPQWQDDCVFALCSAGYAAVGFDLAHTEEGARYMVDVQRPEQFGSLLIRPAPKANLGGIFLCMHAKTALVIPPYPWDGNTRYEYDEDHWRCKQIKQRGGRLGYILGSGGDAEMLSYVDAPEYLETKARDINYIRNVRGIA